MKELVRSGDWLTNEHITLAQALLRNQYPHTAITTLRPK